MDAEVAMANKPHDLVKQSMRSNRLYPCPHQSANKQIIGQYRFPILSAIGDLNKEKQDS
jgi:hypothetical protein